MSLKDYPWFQQAIRKEWESGLLQLRDFPDHEPPICHFWGCGAHLTMHEQLCGCYCSQHSIRKPVAQPGGSEDVVNLVSF